MIIPQLCRTIRHSVKRQRAYVPFQVADNRSYNLHNLTRGTQSSKITPRSRRPRPLMWPARAEALQYSPSSVTGRRYIDLLQHEHAVSGRARGLPRACHFLETTKMNRCDTGDRLEADPTVPRSLSSTMLSLIMIVGAQSIFLLSQTFQIAVATLLTSAQNDSL